MGFSYKCVAHTLVAVLELDFQCDTLPVRAVLWELNGMYGAAWIG